MVCCQHQSDGLIDDLLFRVRDYQNICNRKKTSNNCFLNLYKMKNLLLKDIRQCSCIALNVGITENNVAGSVLRHTGFIVSIDGLPKYSIDFGVEDALIARAVASVHCAGDISVNSYTNNNNNWKIPMNYVWGMNLNNEKDRKRARVVVSGLLDSACARKYNLLLNNCHHYVQAGINRLRILDPLHTVKENVIATRMWINNILSQDDVIFYSIAGTLIVGLGVVAYKLATSRNDDEQ